MGLTIHLSSFCHQFNLRKKYSWQWASFNFQYSLFSIWYLNSWVRKVLFVFGIQFIFKKRIIWYSLDFQKRIYLVFGIWSIFTIRCNSGVFQIVAFFLSTYFIYHWLLKKTPLPGELTNHNCCYSNRDQLWANLVGWNCLFQTHGVSCQRQMLMFLTKTVSDCNNRVCTSRNFQAWFQKVKWQNQACTIESNKFRD